MWKWLSIAALGATITASQLVITSGDLAADALPPQPKTYGEGVPEQGLLTLKTDHYEVPFSAEQAWTIREMRHDGVQFGMDRGFYGTVLIPEGGQWWGTGHTEGGREIVHGLRLTVDGHEVPVKVGETVTGHAISLVKDSTIWKLRANVEIVVTDTEVYERTRLQATEDVALKLMYYFMHSFPPSTTKWIAELPDGRLEEGDLGVSDSFRINQDTRWVAQYEPGSELGILAYTPEVISGPGSASMIWDKAVYHKYYIRSNLARSLQAGDMLDYSIIIKAVPGETGDWAATKQAVEQLRHKWPMVEE